MTPDVQTLLSDSPERTREIGREIGAACQGGEVIELVGELGAGKTCLTGGLAEGLGIAEPAISPTFVLMRSYRGDRGLTLHHLDFYRLSGPDDLETVGFEDCLAPDTVTVIEWPDRCPGATEAVTCRIELTETGEETRRIEIRRHDRKDEPIQ